LLKGYDKTLGLSSALAACLSDTRHPDRISHTLHDLLRQRLYDLACGYEDCNDARRLKEDPVQKLLLDRAPVNGQGIASQTTLPRFENAVGSRQLLRLSYALADSVLGRHRKRSGLVSIDSSIPQC